MSTNRIRAYMDQEKSKKIPESPLQWRGFAVCYLPGFSAPNPPPMASAPSDGNWGMNLVMAAHEQAQKQVTERLAKEEWQQIMSKCGIDYQI